MAGIRTGLRLAAAVAMVSVLAPVQPAVAAPVAAACGTDAAQPGNPIVDVPWQQKWLDPERVWQLATGAGQTVAVIDTGVDDTHQQLRGQVLPGFDELRGVPQGNVDCVSHGTAVASLIAATKVDSVGFHGIAPGARILPVRVSNVDPATDPDGPKQATPEAVASAITWAAANGATVIEVSPSFLVNVPALRDAVQTALAKGIPIVAAAGDRRNPDYVTDPPTYPAAYDGVIGVGALGATFDVWSSSNIGSYVRVCAPGDGVVADTRLAGQLTWSGTSIAAGSVAGTVALLRQVAPRLTPAQVAARIEATADPVPGGQLGPAYGNGLVDPYRAVTEQVTAGHAQAIPGVAAPSVDPAAVARATRERATRNVALDILAGLGGLLVLFVATALVLPRGKQRGWRPTRASRPPDRSEEPVVDDEQHFALPKAHG